MTASPPCRVVTFPSVVLAVTEAELSRTQVPSRILGMFDIVYSWRKGTEVRQVGHNYAVYEKGTRRDLLMKVGFPVSERFADTDRVKCVELAEGWAAHAMHVGPYTELHRTYTALTAWCARESLPLSGQSWEVYGDWQDDAAKLQTGLYFRLR